MTQVLKAFHTVILLGIVLVSSVFSEKFLSSVEKIKNAGFEWIGKDEKEAVESTMNGVLFAHGFDNLRKGIMYVNLKFIRKYFGCKTLLLFPLVQQR